MRCAVRKCKQSNSIKLTPGKSIHFYSFPKDAAQRTLWIIFCNRRNAINAQNERICSLHFKQEDFDRNLKFELGFSNRRAPKLKPGAVPTVAMSAIANEVQTNHYSEESTSKMADPEWNEIKTLSCGEKSTPMTTDINEDGLQMHIQILETEIDALRHENDMLKMLQSQSAITIKNVSCQLQSLNFTNGNLEKALRRLFTDGQMKKIKNGDKRQNFTEADIAQSIALYSTSAKAYRLLKSKHFPLPSVRTLQRWSQKLDVSTGVLGPVVKISSAANQMSETQKLCVKK